MDQASVYNLYRAVVVTTGFKRSPQRLLAQGRAASWYTFRAHLEKHLPCSIDESSRKTKTEH